MKDSLLVVVQGYEINISPEDDRVTVLDKRGDLGEERVSYIVNYLHEEGFITSDEIICEIVTR